jgi:hypothetical protein
MLPNRRAYPRLVRHQRVKIKILTAADTPHLERRQFSCSTEDVSVAGIQFSIRKAIDVNVTLELQIEYPHPRRKYKLLGRVVWTRKEEPKNMHRVGVFFIPSPTQDLTAWRKMLSMQKQAT